MWVRDFLAAEAECKSLSTHLKANNPFSKFYVKEYYLPEHMRVRSGVIKCSRLFFVLLIYFLVCVVLVGSRDVEYG